MSPYGLDSNGINLIINLLLSHMCFSYPKSCFNNILPLVLVHLSCITLYVCTNLVHLYSRAPISCTKNLVHLSYLCTSRASLWPHAPISCTSHTCAPLVHHSVLVHCYVISCTTLMHHSSTLVHNPRAQLSCTTNVVMHSLHYSCTLVHHSPTHNSHS